MARTAKAVTDLDREAGVDTPAAGVYTTIDATLVTNGLSITGAGAKRGTRFGGFARERGGGWHRKRVSREGQGGKRGVKKVKLEADDE